MTNNDPSRTIFYDSGLRLLHWLIAVMIAVVYVLAQIQDALPRGAARELTLLWHEWLGLAVILLLAPRLARRLAAPIPAHEDIARWQRLAARAVQWTLYALMIVVPVSGLIESWARGRSVSFFGLVPLPSLVAASRPLARAVGETHELAAHALVAIAGVHAAAALWHHLVEGDGVLVSMWPRLRRGAER